MNKLFDIKKYFKIKNISLYFFVILILTSFTLTYILLIPGSNLVKDNSNIIKLLILDIVLVIILISLVIRQIVLIFIRRKKNLNVSKLYIKFINLFIILTLVPTIGVVIVSGLFYNLEIKTWFGPAVKTTILNSNVVANDYLKLKTENLEVNIEAISRDIFNLVNVTKLQENRINMINLNHEKKKLTDIFIFNSANDVLSFSSIKKSSQNFFPASKEILKILDSGKIYITQKDKNILSAYYKLNFFEDSYLLINDDINEIIYNHLFETAKAITAYNNLEKNTSNFQISFSMIYVLFSVCLLLIAILIGFMMANKLSTPITNLIKSSEKVSKGDFDAKITEINDSDEISLLLKSFNKMISEIEISQKQLIDKNIEIENRRLFTEAVLRTLSTGVIALDMNFSIKLINNSVSKIINKSEDDLIGNNFFDIFQNSINIKKNIDKKIYKNLSEQIEFNLKNNTRNLFIKFSLEKNDNEIVGYVVTIDDLTSLILAEKHAAWSDIARKIAHEIKNPLTPIKLSAERIEKKIKDNDINKENFISLAGTISKQVDDIGKLIDEFSSFARLPQAEIKKDDFSEAVNECFKLYSSSYSKINFSIDNKYNEILCFFDKFQISLVLNNITKNAIEAVEKLKNPSISFLVIKNDNIVNLDIVDNGIGIDKKLINKIFEPYYTTKDKGTGLGLSICKKIIEEHGGEISIKKNKSTGSTVSIKLLI